MVSSKTFQCSHFRYTIESVLSMMWCPKCKHAAVSVYILDTISLTRQIHWCNDNVSSRLKILTMCTQDFFFLMCDILRDIPKTFLRAALSWHLVRLPILQLYLVLIRDVSKPILVLNAHQILG